MTSQSHELLSSGRLHQSDLLLFTLLVSDVGFETFSSDFCWNRNRFIESFLNCPFKSNLVAAIHWPFLESLSFLRKSNLRKIFEKGRRVRSLPWTRVTDIPVIVLCLPHQKNACHWSHSPGIANQLQLPGQCPQSHSNYVIMIMMEMKYPSHRLAYDWGRLVIQRSSDQGIAQDTCPRLEWKEIPNSSNLVESQTHQTSENTAKRTCSIVPKDTMAHLPTIQCP